MGRADVPGNAEPMRRSLERLRGRARAALVARRVSVTSALFVLAAVALGVIDWALRFPAPVRAVFWLAGAAALGWAAWRYVWPAVRFRPSLTDLALRIERTRPELAGWLASAVDFSAGEPGAGSDVGSDGLGEALAVRVVDEAASRWRPEDASAALRLAPAARAGGGLLGAAGLAALLLVAVGPALWLTGASRVLAPWGDAAWPKRTGVVDATGVEVHPLGQALALRATLTKSPRPADETDVSVRYRLIRDGGAVSTRRELLTPQSSSADGSGTLFERLVEPSAEAIEYRFETEDDATAWRRVLLVEAPEVVRATAVVRAPEYARGLEGAGERRIELGPGTDERAAPAALLSGSSVAIEVELNKPALVVGPTGPSERLDPLIDPERAELVASSVDGGRLSALLSLGDTLRLPIRLVDEHGIESVEEAVFVFEATRDRAPAATVTEPPRDLAVLATAVVEARAEGRDDVGLEWVSLESAVFGPAGAPGGEPSGPGGALESRGLPAELARSEIGGARTSEVIGATLELSTLDLSAGDEVRLTALASDLLTADDAARSPTRSGVRTLRIIAEEDFVREVRERLADVRQAAMRLAAQQSELRESTARGGVTDDAARRGQGQITERIARQAEALQRVAERVDRNRLEDAALAELLREAAGALDGAGASSGEASEAMDDAAEAERAGAAPGEEEAERVAGAQERAREDLERVVELLDRGEDSWVVRNALGRMLREQRELRERTARLGQRTAGRSAEELGEEERREQEEIAGEQDELAEELDRLVQEMREREESLSRSDPMSAMGMREAAQRAERQRTSERMREAAERAQQNRMADAQQGQEQAEEALEEMLEDLDAGERNRDEALRRLLSSLIESIGLLIRTQSDELVRLDEAERAGDDLASLDAPMIALNLNTLGVADQARAGGADLVPVVGSLSRAAAAQGSALAAMRRPDPEADAVRRHELRSLDLLREAERLAEQTDDRLEQQEQERKKRELKRAYREALTAQVELRDEAAVFAEAERLDRRDRVRVRGLAARQAEIRDTLREILSQTEGLAAAAVYAHAHGRLDGLCEEAVGSLTAAAPAAAVRRQATIIALLRSVLESLEDPEDENDEFGEQAGGGGGGGGSGAGAENPLVTMLGELRLLRSMQTIVAQETSGADVLDGGLLERALDDLASQQRELADIAGDLITRLQETPAPEDVLPRAERPEPTEPGEGDTPLPPEPEPGPDPDDNDDGAERPEATR